jgi:hypothetical protein
MGDPERYFVIPTHRLNEAVITRQMDCLLVKLQGIGVSLFWLRWRAGRRHYRSRFVAPVEHLDLATVIKVSQAVSGEIVLEKLIDTLMRTAIPSIPISRRWSLICSRRGLLASRYSFV